MKTFNYRYEGGNLEDLIDFERLKRRHRLLIQVFCGEDEHVLSFVMKSLHVNLPEAMCIGTTTDGEICDDKVSTNKTIISITVFRHTDVKTTHLEHPNSFYMGQELANRLVTPRTKLLIVFTDGTQTNAEECLKGISSIAPTVPVAGGMAGDNGRFYKTFIASQATVLSKGVAGVSLDSDFLQVSADYKFDWVAIGLEHTIDEVEGNRIYKINGRSPLEFYEKYLGDDISVIEFPLMVERDGVPCARAVIQKHDDGSITCTGNLYKGDKIRIGYGDAKSLMRNPINVMKRLQTKSVKSFFIYSCMARRRYMPDFMDVQLAPFANLAPTAGFFTYAEFYHHEGCNEVMNQTLTAVALSEMNRDKEVKELDDASDAQIGTKASYAHTIQSLSSLVEQSARDYEAQSKELEAQRNYSEKLLTSHKKFLRYTVHEMNTPLSVILQNIELHEMTSGKSLYLGNIEIAVKSIFSLYDDLSYLVKKNQITYFKQTIDLVDYIRSRIDFFEQVVIKAKSKFMFHTTHQEIPIFFNDTKLQRIVDNNLTNAIKFTQENEPITIYVSQENTECVFTITSKSRKIHDPQKVFEEHYREASLIEGFGLGLNLVKTICDEEHVAIDLKSSEEKTTFTYTFKVYHP